MALSKIDPNSFDVNSIGQYGGRRNLIINGAMQVAQRGTSFTGVTSSAYHLDRWLDVMNMGTWTIALSTDAPDGFSNSLRWDCTTANASPSSGSEVIFVTRFEGNDLQHLKYGTSNASSLTLSFWVKSNKTGTYTVEFDQYGDRQISRTYTINSADTWEYKTVTVPGDTGGSIDNDNSAEFQLLWWLGAGSNLTSGTLNTSAWASTTNANRVSSSNVNLADSTNNDWSITGIQLEVGSVATPFEYRSYGEELSLCKRYYHRLSRPNYGTNTVLTGSNSPSHSLYVMHMPVSMRAGPSISKVGTNYTVYATSGSSQANTPNAGVSYGSFGFNGGRFLFNLVGDVGRATWLDIDNDDTYWEFSAEL